MIARRSSAEVDAKLDPVRWPRPPRRGTVLRAALVAALLVAAAGVLYSGDGSCAEPAGRQGVVSTAATPSDPSRTAAEAARGSDRLPLPRGLVGVPVRLAEPSAVSVVAAGDRVDLLAVRSPEGATDGEPALLAPGALVLGVLDPPESDATTGTGAIYLALDQDQARKTLGMPEDTRFGIIVR